MVLTSESITLFLAVVEHGSFSAAARKLRRVPSAVSMGIANIEAELGYQLFDRSGREPIPTSRAMALVPEARAIDRRLRVLNSHAIELGDDLESGLKIGISAGIDRDSILDAMNSLLIKYPLLSVDTFFGQQDDIQGMLHSGQIDFAIMFSGSSYDRDELFRHVGMSVFVAVVSATVGTAGIRSDFRYLEELGGARQILVASHERPISDKRLQLSDSLWRTNSVESAIELVARGAGWANLPVACVQSQIDSGLLRKLEFENTENGLPIPQHAVWLRKRPLRKAAVEIIGLIAQ
ncbi:DNA-binding transcriptional LysR family regulator [Rhodococcus sp. 27YEA15]|uniref:LysR family transcriptional regulator n=1 Tax=Rhodococcus sp. 27YEA15 TaxID=3156259 RepID=UPI003C79B9B7